MKCIQKIIMLIGLVVFTLSISSCRDNTNIPANTTTGVSTTATAGQETTEVNTETTTEMEQAVELIEPNKPLFTDIYFADPSAHVFEGKVYIYPSHDFESGIAPDNNGSQYAMEDYHVLSMDNFETPCVDNGLALHLDDVPWASKQLWAPDAAFKNDTYYLYFPAKDKEDIFRIGVATSSSPIGPFAAEENYIEGSYSIDPAVFTDQDNTSYMVFGGIWGGQLERWQSGEYDSAGQTPEGSDAALGPMIAPLSEDMLSFAEVPKEIVILDEAGNPIQAGDENRRFFEGAWLHRYNGVYYLSYSTGTTHTIVYATSQNIEGPYTFKGKILDPVVGWTTHHSIVEVGDQWVLFYHDASLSGVDYLRSVMYTELSYNDDGTIVPIE